MELTIFTIFHVILNMSITSGVIITAVLLLRLLFQKAPKIYSYLLWFLILFRLLCPVSPESGFSIFQLLNKADSKSYVMEPVPYDISDQAIPKVNLYLPPLTDSVNRVLPAATPYQSMNPVQGLLYLVSFLWIFVVVLLLINSLFSYFSLRNRLLAAYHLKDNIYQFEEIPSPFVFGLLHPRIYLPLTLSEEESKYIISHEKMHIRRLDHIIKLVWQMALCLHWFNPLVWLSFHLMTKDMEMSCDEAVLRILGTDIKTNYSHSLLRLSMKDHSLKLHFPNPPLFFGESELKSRIKNILRYKQPLIWVTSLMLTAILLIAVTFLTDPKSDKADHMKISNKAIAENATTLNNSGVTKAEENVPAEDESDSWGKASDSPELSSMGELVSRTPMGTAYSITKIVKDSDLVQTLDITSVNLMDLIDQIILLQYLRSYISPGIDINSLDEYWKIQITLDEKTAPLACYLYVQNGIPYIQLSDKSEKSQNGAIPLKEYGILRYIVSPDKSMEETVNMNLTLILTSPLAINDPYSYIKKQPKEVLDILAFRDNALYYMLSCFQNGEGDTIKGRIMMYLCEELLGDRSYQTVKNMLPTKWYKDLQISP